MSLIHSLRENERAGNCMSKSFFRCAGKYYELCKSNAAGFQSNTWSSRRKGFTGIPSFERDLKVGLKKHNQ